MVGVPGKSKGCLTCRRRKIRCDLAKPDCKNCTQRGRICEGYARYPTFLNNTLAGRQKRYGFEEAKPRTLGPSAPTSNPSISAARSESVGNGLSGGTSATSAVRPAITKQASNIDLQDDQILACFWYRFVPVHVSARDPSPAPWLQEILSSRTSSPALRSSLRALAMTRLGWIHGDVALSALGRNQYGLALKYLQMALYDKNLTWQDDTLAAAYCLSIYEVFEATDDNTKGWNSHVSGMGQLFQVRGPNNYRSPLARALLHGFSQLSMIQSIQTRKRTFLNKQQWRTDPWKHHIKDIHQRLLEYGFEFGAVTEDADTSGFRGDLEDCISYPRRYDAIDTGMDAWFQDFLAESPSPLFWLSEEDNSEAPVSAPPKYFVFPSLKLATITLNCWALKLIVSNIIASICSALLSNHPALHSNAPEPIAHPQGRQLLLKLLDRHSKSHCLDLAIKIMRTMPYVLNDSMGMLSSQQALFPLRVVLFVLRQYPGDELRWCQTVYHKLEAGKGLRYATEIGKVERPDPRAAENPTRLQERP